MVPPSLITFLSPIDSSGMTVCGSFDHLQPLGRALVRDHPRAGVLERLAARDVVEVVVAVDQVLDRLVGDLLDLVDILLPAGRAAIGDRVGRDDAVLGDDEHRLVIAIAEDVDALGPLDLGGGDLRPLRLSRWPGQQASLRSPLRRTQGWSSWMSPPYVRGPCSGAAARRSSHTCLKRTGRIAALERDESVQRFSEKITRKSARQSGISGPRRGYSPPIMPTIFQAPAASLP